MANKVTYTNIPSQKFVNPLSRYASSEVIYWSDNNIATFETYKRVPIQESESDRFVVLNDSTAYRPDRVSYAAYGMVDFWYKIMEANNIFDIRDFKSGITIRLPSQIF